MTFVGLCTDWLKKSKKSQTLQLLFMYRACHKRVKKKKNANADANVVPKRSLSVWIGIIFQRLLFFFFNLFFYFLNPALLALFLGYEQCN